MAINKSQAESIDFARGVSKEAYEKRANYVDTFVKVESAEGRLQRSSKYQTAKAIESLVEAGTTAMNSMAGIAKNKAAELRPQLQTFVADAIAQVEAEEIDNWTQNQQARNLPKLLQIEMADLVARRNHEQLSSKLDLHLAENPHILEDPLAYEEAIKEMDFHRTVSDRENTINDNDPLTLLQNSTAQALTDTYFQKLDLVQTKAYNEFTVSELQDNAKMKAYDLVKNFSQVPYTTVVDGKPVVDELAWAKAVMADLVANEEAFSVGLTKGIEGKLKGDQYETAIQEFLIEYAKTNELEVFLRDDVVPEMFQTPDFDKQRELTIVDIENTRKSNLTADYYKGIQEDRESDRTAQEEMYQRYVTEGFIVKGENEKWDRFQEKAASDYNKKFNSNVDETSSKATQKLLTQNLIRARSSGIPWKNENGQDILVDGKPINVNDQRAVVEYIRRNTRLRRPETLSLLSNIDGILKVQSLEGNQFLKVGLDIADSIAKGEYGTTTDPVKQQEFTDIFTNLYELRQSATPDVDITLDAKAMREIQNQAVETFRDLYDPNIPKGDGRSYMSNSSSSPITQTVVRQMSPENSEKFIKNFNSANYQTQQQMLRILEKDNLREPSGLKYQTPPPD